MTIQEYLLAGFFIAGILAALYLLLR